MRNNIKDIKAVDDVELALALQMAVPLAVPVVLMMSIVGPTLLVGSVVFLIDGTITNHRSDLMMMILTCVLSLLALWASVRAFFSTRNGEESMIPKFLIRLLPLLWVVGAVGGYWASHDIIETQNRRSAEGAIADCGELMERSDKRWEKCLAAVPICDEEANRCKKIGSAEEVKACTEEFTRRRSALNKNDLLKIDEPNGNYVKELNKICLFENIND